MSRIKAYYRVCIRVVKQKLGKEKTHFQETKFRHIFYYFSKVNSYYKKEKNKLKGLEEYNDKVKFINGKDIKCILNNKSK